MLLEACAAFMWLSCVSLLCLYLSTVRQTSVSKYSKWCLEQDATKCSYQWLYFYSTIFHSMFWPWMFTLNVLSRLVYFLMFRLSIKVLSFNQYTANTPRMITGQCMLEITLLNKLGYDVLAVSLFSPWQTQLWPFSDYGIFSSNPT